MTLREADELMHMTRRRCRERRHFLLSSLHALQRERHFTKWELTKHFRCHFTLLVCADIFTFSMPDITRRHYADETQWDTFSMLMVKNADVVATRDEAVDKHCMHYISPLRSLCEWLSPMKYHWLRDAIFDYDWCHFVRWLIMQESTSQRHYVESGSAPENIIDAFPEPIVWGFVM